MRKLSVFLMLALIMVMAVLAQADVVIKMKTAVNTMGMINTDGTSTEYIRPDMSATDNSVKMSGGMMAMMGNPPDQKTIDIVRVDKGVRWEVDRNKKTYTELQLAALKEDIAGEEGGENELFGEAENYDWTVQITTVDNPKDINGFKCKGIIADAKGVSKKDPQEKTSLLFEYWYAKDIDGYDILQQYQKNYAQATEMDLIESRKEMSQIYGKMGEDFDEIFTAMQKADGYPIRTVVTVKGSSVASGDVRDEHTQKGARPGMMDMFKNMQGDTTGEKPGDGMVVMMSVTNEVQSIKQEPADDSKYNVPEGFEQK